jgi:hypothetical protein
MTVDPRRRWLAVERVVATSSGKSNLLSQRRR